jgi:hypothetical protein
MTGTAWIALFPFQPAKGTVSEGFSLLMLSLQQLRQSCGELLGSAAVGITFPAMPVAVPEAQLLMQSPGIGLGLRGPEGHGHRCGSLSS